MYKGIIFDLDGTLLDTQEGVVVSLKETLKELEQTEVEEDIVRQFIGPPLTDSFRQFLGYDEKAATHGAAVFKNYYQKKGIYIAREYPGIKELLKECRDRKITLAVATNKTHENAIKILEYFELSSFFHIIQGNQVNRCTTKQEAIYECMKSCGLKRAETLLIGDSIIDGQGAVLTGIDFLAVTYGYGFHKKQELDNVHPVAVCQNTDQIMDYIKGEGCR
ncbi:MAG: HAD hydrolase-like protein [Lachnospiraceae bacterium]